MSVLLRNHRRQRRHGRAAQSLAPVDHFGQDTSRGAGAEMGHFFTGEDENSPVITRRDRLKSGHERRRAGGGCGFNARRGSAGQAERVGDLGCEIAVAGKLLRVHRADVERVDRVNLGVGHGLRCGLAQDRRERTRILAELCHAGAGDVNRLHRGN